MNVLNCFLFVFFLIIVVVLPLWGRECGISHRFQYISVLTGKHLFVCYLGSGYLIANYLGKITLFLTVFSLQSERCRKWLKSSKDFFSIPEFKTYRKVFVFVFFPNVWSFKLDNASEVFLKMTSINKILTQCLEQLGRSAPQLLTESPKEIWALLAYPSA